MPQGFAYGQNYDLLPLVQAELLNQGMKNRRILDLFPLGFLNSGLVEWEQLDMEYGAMALRGVGGMPASVQMVGWKQFAMKPGSYGEFIKMDYQQLTEMRQPGTKGDTIDLDYIANLNIRHLTARALNRVEWIEAQLLATGQFYLATPDNGIVHTDSIQNYQVILPATNWATTASSVVVDDFLNGKAKLQKGTSSQFNEKSTFICNSFTMNDILQSNQFRAVFKMNYGQTPTTIGDINKLFNSLGLPTIEVYDGGYYTIPATASTPASGWVYFLPRGYGIWLGHRPDGAMIGEFILTRNPDAMKPEGAAVDYRAKNPDVTGPDWLDGLYTRFYVHTDEPPTYWRWDVGFNGGPALLYRTASAGLFYSASQP